MAVGFFSATNNMMNKKSTNTNLQGNGNGNGNGNDYDDTTSSNITTAIVVFFVIDLVICFSALYCFFKCVSNRKDVDSLPHFISACCCPICYIAWVFGTGKCSKT